MNSTLHGARVGASHKRVKKKIENFKTYTKFQQFSPEKSKVKGGLSLIWDGLNPKRPFRVDIEFIKKSITILFRIRLGIRKI